MDMRGAVELGLPATELSGPGDLSDREAAQTASWARDWGASPQEWVRFHLTRLALACALEARLLHVRAGRLHEFSLVADPDRVTLAQLAALTREHHGMRGQAFELAVADAVQRGVFDVIEPLRRGLQYLRADTGDPLSMVVLGLEKIPPQQAASFYAEVARMLPELGVLRTGMPGRPVSVATALDRLSLATWTAMGAAGAGSRTEVSQLGRADALLICGSNIVPVSLKIRQSAVPPTGWRDVPLWVTTGPRAGAAPRSGPVPQVVVTLGCEDAWFGAFMGALDLLGEALAAADRGWLGTGEEVAAHNLAILKVLWRMRQEPISAITEVLRRVHGGMWDLYGPQIEARTDSVSLETLEVPDLVAAWQHDADTGALFLQRHLFPRSEAA